MGIRGGLRLRRFGVAFSRQVVLAHIDLDVTVPGMTVLVGPAGAGKSTLLRTLAGVNDAQPELRTWGESSPTDGGPAPRVALVMQNARLLTSSVRENVVSAFPDRHARTQVAQARRAGELLCRHGLAELATRLDEPVVHLGLPLQRRLAVVRALSTEAPLICADEPTAGLDDPDGSDVVELLRSAATERGVLFVTHNQKHARAVGGRVALLAGGRIRETAPSKAFFSRPATAEARTFLRTGRCVAAETPERGHRGDPPLGHPAAIPLRAPVAPAGFRWLKPGRLGGVPRPGLLESRSRDLLGLRQLGVTVLVTLEETRTIDPLELRRYGIASRFYPIADMGAPSVGDAVRLCRELAALESQREVTAVHCRAGLGRTGTVLASYLVWEGATALEALEAVRSIHPLWVQSPEQVEFLNRFQTAVAGRAHASPAPEV